MPDTSPVKYDAAILAGGGPSPFARHLPNKTFIRIRGRCLFAHVVNALLHARRVKRIYVVGPKEAIEKELAADKDLPLHLKPVKAVQESNNIVDNMFNAFAESIGGYAPGEEFSNVSLQERAIFGVGGDCPLIIPEEVDEFLGKCDTSRYDYFLGMTTEQTLRRFYEHSGHRGIRLAYTPFAEGMVRISNMHLAKPFRIANRNEFHAVYQLRHLKKIWNIVRFMYALTKRGLSPEVWAVCLRMFAGFMLRKWGFAALAEQLRARSPMGVVIGASDKMLGTRSTIVLTTCGGAALDVDKPSNAPLFETYYDEWIALQREKRP